MSLAGGHLGGRLPQPGTWLIFGTSSRALTRTFLPLSVGMCFIQIALSLQSYFSFLFASSVEGLFHVPLKRLYIPHLLGFIQDTFAKTCFLPPCVMAACLFFFSSLTKQNKVLGGSVIVDLVGNVLF